jgi:dienelactone hydrolase
MKAIIGLLTVLISVSAFAKVKIEKIEYKSGDTVLAGAKVYDPAMLKKNKKLPGVVIVHDWMGVGEYVMMRAEQMANLGYIAFVADIYGKGNNPKNTDEAGALAGKYKAGDRAEMRARAKAAFEMLASDKNVENSKISAMGYCFGGTTVLEMARMGLPLAGVISFHGGLSAVKPEDAKNIKAKVLVLHGAIDPFESAAEVAQFKKEMNEAKVNYEFVEYSGAVHAFTEKHAGDDITKGAAYNEQADKRSFIAMKDFLAEVTQ